jgi:hypothetical protein
MSRRKHRQRYQEFARFGFDPTTDIALDDHGAWRWNGAKSAMHDYLRSDIAGRQEDDATPDNLVRADALRAVAYRPHRTLELLNRAAADYFVALSLVGRSACSLSCFIAASESTSPGT